MKNEVRPIDANALAKRIKEYMSGFPYARTRLAACRAVLSMLGDEGQTPTLQLACNNVATSCAGHFPGSTKMVPLMLDALREMEKQVVFVDVVKKEFSRICDLKSQFGVVRPEEDRVHLFNGRSVYFASYGAWLAYAYHPAHIDREAWEPCENCKPSCGNCISGDEYEDDCPIECQCCVNHNNYRAKGKYCSACGRPLTYEAWADLGKRLRRLVK